MVQAPPVSYLWKRLKFGGKNTVIKSMISIKHDIEYYPINVPSYYIAIFSAKNTTINKSYSFINLNMILSPAGR